jgi:hypothetical protein
MKDLPILTTVEAATAIATGLSTLLTSVKASTGIITTIGVDSTATKVITSRLIERAGAGAAGVPRHLGELFEVEFVYL